MKRKPHPSIVALDDWPQGWLKFEVANLSKNPVYLVMTDAEKKAVNLPITMEEMRNYIRAKGRRK